MSKRLPLRSVVTNCLVIAPPRSGWSFLRSCLQFRSDVALRDLRGLTHGIQEIKERHVEAEDYYRGHMSDLNGMVSDPLEYFLNSVFDRAAWGESAIVAVVTPQYAERLIESGIHRHTQAKEIGIVWLHRNPAAAYVSAQLVSKTELDWVPAGSKPASIRAIPIDAADLTFNARSYYARMARVRDAQMGAVAIPYENWKNDPNHVSRCVVKYLNLTPGSAPYVPFTGPIYSGPIHTRVSAYDDLVQSVAREVRPLLQPSEFK